MKQNYINYNGKKYPTRDVDLSIIIEGYGVTTIADWELSAAIEDNDHQDGGIDIDNSIYCYLDSGTIASHPTDTEILMNIIEMEGLQLSDQQWYNLMRMATAEISDLYREHKINFNMESYEQCGCYHIYCYNGDNMRTLYDGSNPEMAARLAVRAAGISNLNIL